VSGEQTHFLNVDLELMTRGELAPLLAHWSKAVVVLRDTVRNGDRTVWLELNGQPREVEHAVLGFLDLVGKLPDSVRELWNGCDDRCFNIGIQAGSTPHDSTYTISPRTLGRIAAVMARVAVTVYAPVPNGET
jgi:hypothetical protein